MIGGLIQRDLSASRGDPRKPADFVVQESLMSGPPDPFVVLQNSTICTPWPPGPWHAFIDQVFSLKAFRNTLPQKHESFCIELVRTLSNSSAMLLTTLIGLTIMSLLPLAHSSPSKPLFQPSPRQVDPIGSTWCSVDTSNASIVPFAQDPGWKATMSECLSRLNAQNFDGTECVPTSSNGTQLGPTFGFWKAQKRNDIPTYGDVCYARCAPCLQAGIDALWAVTTRCSYVFYPYGKKDKVGCDVGFDYGT